MITYLANGYTAGTPPVHDQCPNFDFLLVKLQFDTVVNNYLFLSFFVSFIVSGRVFAREH